jgi:PAS domain S-box-containing protein
LILDHSPAAIAFRDGDGKVLRINRTSAARLNRPESEIVGRNIRDLFGPQAEEFIAEGREVMRSGKSLRRWNVQYSGMADQSYWHSETVPFYDEQGVAVGVVVMAHDMTEQKLIEAELRRQKEESAIILDNIPSMIFVKDGQNTLLSVNQAVAARLGQRVEELVGKSADDVFPDPEGRYWQEDLNIMRSRKPRFGLHYEFVQDGAPSQWWRYHKVPYFDAAGQALGVIIICDDISADIHAKQALEAALAQARHHEYELDMLFDSLPICVVFKDCDNRILRVNRFAAEFFRVSAAALIGRDLGELILGSELEYRKSDREVLDSGVATLDNIHVLPLADGRRHVVRSHKMRYHDADGKVLGLLIAFQELSETRQLDAGALR